MVGRPSTESRAEMPYVRGKQKKPATCHGSRFSYAIFVEDNVAVVLHLLGHLSVNGIGGNLE